MDSARATRIADAYDRMPHTPQDPRVRRAYQALIQETLAQWEVIKRTGLKVEYIRRGERPYTRISEIFADVNEHNHMWVFPSEAGFGSGTADLRDNPLLAPTNETISGRTAVVNDIFRIVHDYFGHIKDGVGFRANGEENAWRSHAVMFSPLARQALTSETRGQNSWVNFGPHGAVNRTASPDDTIYAEQKTGLLPDWVVTEGTTDADVRMDLEVREPGDDTVSPRNPTGKKSTENALDDPLQIGLEALKADPDAFTHNMALAAKYPNFARGQVRSADKRAQRMIEHMVANLVWLHDHVPAEIRERSQLWYDGANRIATEWAEEYGAHRRAIAGVMAVLSPQKDWFMNVNLARRVLDTVAREQDTPWSTEMEATAARIFGKAEQAPLIDAIRGKALGELDDLGMKATWVRIFDEAHNARDYDVVSPEGDFTDVARNADGRPSKVAWGSTPTIAKAISIFEDPSIENIHRMLGNEHKVRSFYNNIVDPMSDGGHVTIDTHAVAAALLRPLSGNSREVSHNFGSGVLGEPGPRNSIVQGTSGLYGLYAEAYRRAAAARRVLPRQMQSITWEAVRGLFHPSFKAQQRNVDAIDAIWDNFSKGKVSLDEVRQQILELAGGVTAPDWVSAPRHDAEARDAADARAVHRTGVAGRRAGSDDRGGRAAAAAGISQAGASNLDVEVSHGQGNRSRRGPTGRSSVHGRTEGPRSDAAERVDQAFAERYGWTREAGAHEARREEVGKPDVLEVRESYDDADHWKKMGRVFSAAKKVRESLSRGAADDLESWQISNWHLSKVEQSAAARGGMFAEIYKAFEPVRAAIRREFGDRVPLFRAQRTTDSPDAGRQLFSWSAKKESAEEFLGRAPRPITDKMIDDAVERYERTGLTVFMGQKFKRATDGFYTIFNRNNEIVTDGEESHMRADFKSRQADRQEWIDRISGRGDLIAHMVPADRVVAVLDAKPSHEFITTANPLKPDTLDAREGITGTPEFKRWFGDSKVVDANGEPLVVYHGTGKSFDRFSPAFAQGGPMWFTKNTSYASGYAENADGDPVVYPVFLAIKNPVDLSAMNINAPLDVDKLADVSGLDYGKLSYIEQAYFGDFDSKPKMYELVNSEEFVRLARAAGHDGVVAKEGRAGQTWGAFDSEQIKSAIGNNGNFDSSKPSILDVRETDGPQPLPIAQKPQALFVFEGGAPEADATLRASVVTDIGHRFANRLRDLRGLGLQTLGRRQIVEIYGGDIPALHRYQDLAQRMDAAVNATAADADGIADRWGKLRDERALADLLHDATLAEMDPEKPYVDGDDHAKYLALRHRFEALSDDAKQVYRDARRTYNTHYFAVRDAIKKRIERAVPDHAQRAVLLERLENDLGRVKGFYAPLQRYGEYVIVVKDEAGDKAAVSFAETLSEAEGTRTALLRRFPASRGFEVGKILKRKEFNASRDGAGRGFMGELFNVLDKSDASEDLQHAVSQLWLTSLPDLSWRKHGINRKGTPGFSQDARRAFASNVSHGARYLAKLNYSDQLQDALALAQEQVDARAADVDYDPIAAQQVVDEMEKRHSTYMNQNVSQLSTTLTSVGFVFHLGLSPASAAVNLAQTPLVAYPLIAARWGYVKAGVELMRASKQAMESRNDMRLALKGDELRAFDEAVRAGVIDVTLAHDLAGIAAGADTKARWKMRPVMKAASFLFHHAERFNRQATLIAAYRLARDAGKGHDAAYAEAADVTFKAHFDYSAGNRPRFMQGNVARVVLLFKQFAQNMIFTLGRSALEAARGDKEARKVFAGLLVSHALGAGILGLPAVSALLAAASMLGGDDDDPWDAEVALRNLLADALGQKPAEVLAHGLSRLTPWDVSGRIGLDRLIFPDVQEGLDGARLAESWAASALGPVAAIGINATKGLHDIASGNMSRGLEAMLPAALRGPVKALRYAQEGETTRSGLQVLDKTTPAEEIGQALGFSPSRVREANDARAAIMGRQERLKKRRQELLTTYARAWEAKDEATYRDTMHEILEFNKANRAHAILPVNIAASLRMRARRRAEAEGGVYLPRKYREEINEGRFAYGE